MAEPNRNLESLSLEELEALREDTLVLLRKVGDLGEAHNVNGRSANYPQRQALLDQLADIARAIAYRQALAAGQLSTGYARTFVDAR